MGDRKQDSDKVRGLGASNRDICSVLFCSTLSSSEHDIASIAAYLMWIALG